VASLTATMAWRNLWRNPRRTWLTVAAIAFACLLLIFMLSWQFGSYEAMINSAVKIHTGHLHIQAKGYQEDMNMHYVVPKPAKAVEAMNRAPGVAAWTTRCNGFSLVSSKERTYGVLVVGIDPQREARVSTLAKTIRQGDYLKPGDMKGALVGELLAHNLQVGLGDELTVLGQGRDGSVAATVVTVAGIYSTGVEEMDRSSIHIGIKNFQATYSMMGAVHQVVAVCGQLGEVAGAKAYLAQHLPPGTKTRPLVVLDWKQLMPGLIQGIEMDLVSGLIFYFILIIVVAFSILNTFLMSVLERMHEFGVLLSIGATPGRLSRLVLWESVTLTLVGIVCGMVMGIALTLYVQQVGIDLSGASEILKEYGISGRMYPRLGWVSATVGPAAVLVITFLTALYPALKVRRVRPLDALNAV